MKVWERFFLTGEKGLFEKNREAVNEYLTAVVQAVDIIFLFLMGVMTCVSYGFNYNIMFKAVYSSFFAGALLFFAFLRIFKRFIKRHPLFFIYFFFFCFLVFTVLANFAADKPQDYVSSVCAIFIIPLVILDRTLRVNIFVSIALVACLVLSYFYKGPSYMARDSVNLCMYYFAGMALGRSVRLSRLRGYDTERILTVERNTDSLTKLANRRKLFEYLRRGDQNVLMRPTGMFMIDIDKFKQYNDHYGHRAGDICLGLVGKCFAEYGEKNKMKFFRYGGEEFCGLCWTKDYMELASCAEGLLQAVRDLRILFNIDGTASGVVTISIGYAYFDRDKEDYNFETMIKIADSALYSAKSHGRNCARGS